MRRFFRQFTQHGEIFAFVTVCAATTIFLIARNYLDPKRWAIFYLLLISLIARAYGTRAALIAAIASFMAWNYYFDIPPGTIYATNLSDWITLVAFLIVGIIIGVQTGQMREREATAIARERETALLNRLSTSLVSISSTQVMVDTMLLGLCERVDTSDAILFIHENKNGEFIPWRLPPVRNLPVTAEILTNMQWVVEHKQAIGVSDNRPASKNPARTWRLFNIPLPFPIATGQTDILLPVQTVTTLEGVLYVSEHRDGRTFTPHEVQLMIAVANLIASFLERQRLEAAAFAGAALREVDELKSTLISSVSHELKTPLAALNATVTNLLAHDVNWRPSSIAPELETIRNAVGRLSDSISSLVDLSRLQADAWKTNYDWYEMQEIIGAAMTAFPKAQRSRVTYQVAEDLPQLYADFHQLTRVFHHLLENAFAYAPEPSPIRVGAAETEQEICVWLEDAGPGIPPEERERIFDKFYRGAGAKTVPTGTGLGLAIAGEIMRAHHGRIWVEAVSPHGSRFTLALPRGSRLRDTTDA